MLSNSGLPAHSVYIHIPFCRKRCSYCDFNTYAGIESLLPAYLNALCQEIVKVTSANSTRFPVHTVFFGGGTPSLLTPKQLETILKVVEDSFNLTLDAEISMEANPGTIVDDRLSEFHRLGLNRLSFGMQSSKREELNLLARIHTQKDTINSVKLARKAGFDNINLDLIYNLPRQTLADWVENMQAAITLEPEHLSLYSLSVEEGTLLHQQVLQGVYPMPEDDHAADLVQASIEFLHSNGYVHYEISNWAKIIPGRNPQCRHNLQYWKNQPYFGFGAGAHGLVNNVRTINTSLPKPYINQCEQETVTEFPAGPASSQRNPRSDKEQIEDHMILNLRLLQDGVNRQEFKSRFGVDVLETYPKIIPSLLQSGHLQSCNKGKNYRIPAEHFFIANQILVNFLFDEDQ